ncbi:MAG TPA: hypothetical protein VFE33_04840 [Thermoanaerobaculia bacterium]|nr:hypothetical protein [Thermoanaerobaculia bacterium]
MRQFIVVGLLGGATFLAPGASFGQPPKGAEPASVELAQLNLRIAEARVVDSVKLGDAELKPAKDEKLVVVTLRGTLDKPGRLTLVPATFKAMYSWTVSASPPEEKVGKTEGKAVQLGDGSWGTTATNTYTAPKDVTFDIAISVPTQVTQFYVIWDLKKGLRAPVDLAKPGRPR